MPPVTMSEVARRAKVSQTTVSHVINKTRKVDPSTEQAVLDAIRETGYAGDHVARSLRKGRTGTIGLAMSAISNPYFGDVVHSIERTATSAGYSILLAETHSDPADETRAVRHLLAHRVDAFVLASSADPSEALRLLGSNEVPAVLLDRVPQMLPDGFDAVGVTNEEPTAQLVDHLAWHGHRRICFVTGRPNLATTRERIAGFSSGLLRNGLEESQAPILSGYTDTGALDMSALLDLLSQSQPPTALVLGNNQTTISVMQALRQRGMEVPRDIALVAFDDFPWSDLFHPRLTVAAQPVDHIGEAAVQMLLERLANPALEPRERRFDATFIVRDSCGCD